MQAFYKKKGNWELIDLVDLFILLKIKHSKKLGTIELSKQINMAPKNLIERLKKAEKNGWITKKNLPLKPKGRKRIFKVTKIGEQTITSYKEFLKKQEELQRISKKMQKKLKK